MRQGLRLGIDLGGTKVKLALVDASGRLRQWTEVDTVKDPRALVRRMKDAAGPWLRRRVLGTGVGVAGDIDSAKGVVRFSPNLNWRHLPLKNLLRGAGFPAPLVVDNDANAAAWGAYHTELRGRSKALVVLTLGTGVGGGLILNGALHRGVTGSGGELGHMVIDPAGVPCGCGAQGCLETFIGVSYITAWAKKEAARRKRAWPADLSPRDLHAAAKGGDPVAQAVWKRAGTALGIGIANFINIFNPDTILLCGGIAGASDLLLRHARPYIGRAFQTPRRAAAVRVAKDNNHLGVAGAALLVP